MIFRRRNDDSFSTFSITEILTRPFRALFRLVGSIFGADDSIGYERRSILGSLFAVLTWPFRLAFGFAAFMVQSWATNRSGIAFLRGIPAVLVITMFLAGLWSANFLKEKRSVNSSLAYLRHYAVTHPDKPNHSRIFAEKLVELKPQNDDFKYQLALAHVECDEEARATELMNFLADNSDHTNAHVWLARFYLRQRLTNQDSPGDEVIIIDHLEAALATSPDDELANISFAALYEDQASKFDIGSEDYNDRMDKAIAHLKTVVDSRSRVTLMRINAIPKLIQVLIAAGHEDEAKRRLEGVMSQVAPIARQNSDLFSIWHTLVRSAVQLKDYGQAEKIIREGYQLAESKEVRDNIVRLSSEVLLDQAMGYADITDRSQYKARLNLLCRAVNTHPQNRNVYLKLLEFVASNTNPDFNEMWLRDSVIESTSPGVVHVLLGLLEISKGNVLEGQKHWRIAEQQYPLTQYVVNNAIDVASKEFATDFGNMLDVATIAIELFPDQPLLYQTRGAYLKSEGRYQEAVADLEYALEKLPNRALIHKHLIKCYQELGNTDQVLDHQLRMAEVIAELEPSQRVLIESALDKMD